ncbi:hypothetical protein D3C72_1519080 [compost metagenome]
MVRAAVGVGARRDDADGLAFQHRERGRAEIQHDVVGVVFAADFGHAHIAGHGGGDGLMRGFGAVQVGVGMRGGPRRYGGAVAGAVEDFFAGAGQRRYGGIGRCGLHVGAGRQVGQLLRREFLRQRIPAELFFDAVGAQPRHGAPVVDRAGRARGNAGHAQVALVGIDHVVARVVRDRAHRAGRFAGVAADADLGIDQVLLDDLNFCHVHGGLHRIRGVSG